MHQWLNVGHCQFDLWFQGGPQQVIGKMVKVDELGAEILLEKDGTTHSYSWAVIQHVTYAA